MKAALTTAGVLGLVAAGAVLTLGVVGRVPGFVGLAALASVPLFLALFYIGRVDRSSPNPDSPNVAEAYTRGGRD